MHFRGDKKKKISPQKTLLLFGANEDVKNEISFLFSYQMMTRQFLAESTKTKKKKLLLYFYCSILYRGLSDINKLQTIQKYLFNKTLIIRSEDIADFNISALGKLIKLSIQWLNSNLFSCKMVRRN